MAVAALARLEAHDERQRDQGEQCEAKGNKEASDVVEMALTRLTAANGKYDNGKDEGEQHDNHLLLAFGQAELYTTASHVRVLC